MCQLPQHLDIGPLRLDTPVLCAPIAAFTDYAFRGILRELGGCGLIATEMVSAGGWLQGDDRQPQRLDGVDDEPRPLAVQLWDRQPEMIERAAARLVDLRISVIDLNFGCPKERIMGRHGAGAELLRDPATVYAIVAAAVRGAGATPVTAKIRLGCDIDHPTAPDVARAAEAAGAAAITVHGRAAEQGYSVPSNLDRIADVVAAVDVPVIANGDIDSADRALETLRSTGAAGVMVARAALTRPWVFREITAALRGEVAPPPPTPIEQRDQLLRHHAALLERRGQRFATVRMRKFAGRYCAGIPGVREFRKRISFARDSEDFLAIVRDWFPVATS